MQEKVLTPKDIMPILRKSYQCCWIFLRQIKNKRQIKFVTTRVFKEETGITIDL